MKIEEIDGLIMYVDDGDYSSMRRAVTTEARVAQLQKALAIIHNIDIIATDKQVN